MQFANMIQEMIFVIVLAVIGTYLQGCNGSSAAIDCTGDSCNCYVNFYAMDANISIGATQIEHASRRFTVTGVENNVKNATTAMCCLSVHDLIKAQIQGVAPQKSVQQDFCDNCRNSPNADVTNAAKKCSAPPKLGGSDNRATNRLLTAMLESQKVESKETPLVVAPPSEDDYVDCNIVFVGADAKLTLNGVAIDNAQSDFRIKWTDKASGDSQPCCASLRPLITSMYVKGTSPTKDDEQTFCNACKDAYNTGVALAAYRTCQTSAALVV